MSEVDSQSPNRSEDEKTPMVIKNPLIIMFETNDGIQCNIHQPQDWTHQHYGLVICDLVRHVSRAYNVPEAAVWEWVDKERERPTTEIRRPS